MKATTEIMENKTVEKCCKTCKHWAYAKTTDDGLCLKLQGLIKVSCYNGGGVDYIITQKNFLCPNYKES
jgi:hypothetical protein